MFKKNSRSTFQEQLRQKKRKKKGRKILLLCFALIICFSGMVYGLFFSPYFDIQTITVNGTDIVSSDKVKETINTLADEKTWGVFHNRNIFFFPVSYLQTNLFDTFPPIANVTISKKPHIIRLGSWNQKSELVIHISERPHTALSCDSEKCFIVDNNGVLFSSVPIESNTSSLRILESSISSDITLPQSLYSSDFIEFIKKIKKLSADEGVIFDSFSQVNDFGDIQARTANNYSVFFTMSQDAKKQVQILKELLSKMIQGDITKLDYINLRVENRAYYKLKE